MTGKVKVAAHNVTLPDSGTAHKGDIVDWKWAPELVNGRSLVWVSDGNDPAFEDLTYNELRTLATERGVKASGKKADLVARVAATYEGG